MSKAIRYLSLTLLAMPLVTSCAYFGFGSSNIRELARADYSLDPTKAEALANFLTEQLAVEIETKVVGDSIEITTNPAAQAVIEDFDPERAQNLQASFRILKG